MRKHKLLLPLKSLAIIWILPIFGWILKSKNSVEGIILRDYTSWFGPDFKTIGICYYAIVLKEEKKKKKRKNDYSKNVYCQQKKASVTNNISRYVIFDTQGIGCDLSLMRLSYNLTKRTTKTEKSEQYLKMYIINFVRLKATNWVLRVKSLIQYSITSLRDLSAIYGYLENKNRKKRAISRKKLSEKSVEGIKKLTFPHKLFYVQTIF